MLRRNNGVRNENFFSRHSHQKEQPQVPATKSAWAWGEENDPPPPYSRPGSGRLNELDDYSPGLVSSVPRTGNNSSMTGNNSNAIVVCEEASDDENDTGRGAVGISYQNGAAATTKSAAVALPREFDLEDFLCKPVPPGQTLYAYISRNTKGGIKNKMYPKYEMLMDDDHFLMAAKKRKKNTTANYLISKSRIASKKEPHMVLGKVRSNFFGTEFMLYSAGKNPKKGGPADVRLEMGAVTYAQNPSGNGPRTVRVCLPRVTRHGELCTFTDGEESLLHRLKDQMSGDVMQGKNKLPKYDEERHCYTMDFGGRVSMASVKNFQLVFDNDDEHVILQFGRDGKDKFNVDVRWSISPFQAFGICLTSLDSKIASE